MMTEIHDNELVFIFPKVSACAELRVHCHRAHSSQVSVPLRVGAASDDFLVAAHVPLV